MKYQDAKKLFTKQEFPFSDRYEDVEFVVFELRLEYVTPRILSEEFVTKYVEKESYNPIFVKFGRVMSDGRFVPYWNHKAQIIDGNHRAAASALKKTCVSAITPKPDYDFYAQLIDKEIDKNGK